MRNHVYHVYYNINIIHYTLAVWHTILVGTLHRIIDEIKFTNYFYDKMNNDKAYINYFIYLIDN